MANLVMDGVTLASKSGSDVTIQDTNVNFPTKLTDRDIWYPIVEPGSDNSNNGTYLVSGTLDFSSG